MTTTTIAFLNQKGGVGKTSCCHHLAGALAEMGRNVLLVDADPQASLTQGFLGPAEAEELGSGETIAAVLGGESPHPAGVVIRTTVQGIDLLPGSILAADFNATLMGQREPAQARALADFLRLVDHELVLIDCPPNLQHCSWSALMAADWVVVPLQPEDYGSQGVAPVLDFLNSAQRHNPRLGLAGFLLTMVDPRLSIHQTYEERLRKHRGEKVFAHVMPRRAAFAEAIFARTPVTRYAPRSAAAEATRAVAHELMLRVSPVVRTALAAAGEAVTP